MNTTQIKEWFRVLGLKLGPSGGSWVHATCPRAPYAHSGGVDRTPSFGVKVSPGESRVHCFSCTFSGAQTDVLTDMQEHGAGFSMPALDLIIAAEEQAGLELEGGDYEAELFGGSEEHPFPEWALGAFEPAYHEGHVHPYLQARLGGPVPFRVAKALDLRFDTYRQRLVFPIRDWQGRLMGLHGRTTIDAFPPYLMYPWEEFTNPHVLLGEHWVDIEEPLVIAESVFDLARILEVYSNVITPRSASIAHRDLERLVGARRIITAFDNDMAGDAARAKTEKWWDGPVAHMLPPEGGDCGAWPAAELVEVLTPLLEGW